MNFPIRDLKIVTPQT